MNIRKDKLTSRTRMTIKIVKNQIPRSIEPLALMSYLQKVCSLNIVCRTLYIFQDINIKKNLAMVIQWRSILWQSGTSVNVRASQISYMFKISFKLKKIKYHSKNVWDSALLLPHCKMLFLILSKLKLFLK